MKTLRRTAEWLMALPTSRDGIAGTCDVAAVDCSSKQMTEFRQLCRC